MRLLVRLLVRLSLVRLLVRLSLVRLLESGLLVAGPSLLSLTSLSVRSSLVCFLVHLLGSWSLPRGLPLVFHRSVVGHGRSSICSFVARCSARCFLVCCSVTSLSARPSARASLVRLLPVAGLSARSSLVHLFGSWSLVCLFGSCIARPSDSLIIRLVVHRSSPIPLRWSVAGPSSRHSSARPSARVMVGVSSLVHLLVSHWPVYCSRGHGSYRWSVCSLVTRPSVRVMSLVRLLARRSSVCSGRGHWLAHPSAGLLFVRRWPWSSICHSYIARASA